MCEFLRDVFVNVFSSFVFIIIVAGLLWLINWVTRSRKFTKAEEFFGFTQQQPVRIVVSGFPHENMASRRVVTAVEYAAATDIRDKLRQLPKNALENALSGLIGRDNSYTEPVIDVSPLEAVATPQFTGPLILIGGPLTNQLLKHYIQDGKARFRYQKDAGYQQLVDGNYQNLPSQNNLAILEKRVIGDQVVILAHGNGEADTARAARYLVNNWQNLHKLHGKQEFAMQIGI